MQETKPAWPEDSEVMREFFKAEKDSQVVDKMNDRLMDLQTGNPPHELVRRVKIGRNQSCPCGSGRKFKKCCIYKAK